MITYINKYLVCFEHFRFWINLFLTQLRFSRIEASILSTLRQFWASTPPPSISTKITQKVRQMKKVFQKTNFQANLNPENFVKRTHDKLSWKLSVKKIREPKVSQNPLVFRWLKIFKKRQSRWNEIEKTSKFLFIYGTWSSWTTEVSKVLSSLSISSSLGNGLWCLLLFHAKNLQVHLKHNPGGFGLDGVALLLWLTEQNLIWKSSALCRSDK